MPEGALKVVIEGSVLIRFQPFFACYGVASVVPLELPA
jgi:hypothetical protein